MMNLGPVRLACLPLAVSLVSLSACGPIVIPKTLTDEERVAAAESKARRDEVTAVASWMTGSFSSAAQAASDPDFLDIRLEMARIWEDRQDGIWIYVEQAAAASLDKPYRQRIYRVFVQPNGLIVSEVYEFPGAALRFAGAHRRPELLDEVTPRTLTLKDGCQVVLRRASDTAWVGGTVGSTCLSSLRGAHYATSEVAVTPDGLRTLDRGFDEQGKQVWGSTKGAYIFDRVR
jgi:hypothetical protein